MSAERATYLDSSAIVKLAVAERESAALRRYLRRRPTLVSSALSRTEVTRALLPLGRTAVERGEEVLTSIDLIRISDRILRDAGRLGPESLRSLDAIHLATARLLRADLDRLVTYDLRMSVAAAEAGLPVTAPA
jgi:predicted nucleic acid-binding protein